MIFLYFCESVKIQRVITTHRVLARLGFAIFQQHHPEKWKNNLKAARGAFSTGITIWFRQVNGCV